MFVVGHIYFIFCSFLPKPHEKISVCICGEEPLFFWISSDPHFHGIGQHLVPQAFAPNVLGYDSWLDLSGPKTFTQKDLDRARDQGMISDDLRALIMAELAKGNSMLSPAFAQLAISNLTPPAASSPPTGGSAGSA